MEESFNFTAYQVGPPPIFPAAGVGRAVAAANARAAPGPTFPAERTLLELLTALNKHDEISRPIFASGALSNNLGTTFCMVIIMALKAATIEIEMSRMPRSYAFLLRVIDIVLSRLQVSMPVSIDLNALALHTLGLKNTFVTHASQHEMTGHDEYFLANIYSNVYTTNCRNALALRSGKDHYLIINPERRHNYFTVHEDNSHLDPLRGEKSQYLCKSMDNNKSRKLLTFRKSAVAKVICDNMHAGRVNVPVTVKCDLDTHKRVVNQVTTPAHGHASATKSTLPTAAPSINEALSSEENDYGFRLWRFAERMPLPSEDARLNISNTMNNIVTLN